MQEQDALRRQLEDQELLLKAYQAENELAVARIKQQAAEQQRQAAEAARQVEELQQALALAQAERARQPPATPAVDAARLQQLLRLQADLESVRAAASQREGELQRQVRRSRMLLSRGGWSGARLSRSTWVRLNLCKQSISGHEWNWRESNII